MKHLYFYLMIFLWFFPNGSRAQQPFFKELNIDPQNDNVKATAVYQDKDEIIYVGTDMGLFKYDGFNFTLIDFPEKIISKEVKFIKNVNNELWVCMGDGSIFTYSKEKRKILKSPIKSPVSSIVELDNKTVWVSTYGEGIFYRIGKDWHRLSGIPDPYIYQIVKHPSGYILAGTDAGLIVINPTSDPISFRVYNSTSGLPDNIVKTIGIHPDGKVLLGLQEQGLFHFNMKDKSFKNVEINKTWHYGALNSIVSLQNEFWLGTDGFGLVDYEFSGDRRLRNFNFSKGFPYKKVTALMRDREGNVWIIGDNKLIYSPGEKVEFVSDVGNFAMDSIQAITSSKDGYIWLSKPSGLFRFDYLANDQQRIRKYPLDASKKKLHVVSLYEDRFGFIWVGTFDDALYRLEPITGKVKKYTSKDGLINANIISISGDKDAFWLATLEGVVRCKITDSASNYNEPKYTFSNKQDFELPFNGFVYKIFVDSRGRVWFGTDGKGIVMYEKNKIQEFSNLKNGKVIYSITEDHYGNIWFSTQHQGLIRYDGKSFRNFNLSNGLSALDISGIESDNIGNIVVIHSKGLDIINSKTFEIEKISSESGINTIDADLNTIARDGKGGVWIGSRNKLFRYYSYIKERSYQPHLILNAVYTFMKQSVDIRDSVFEYNQNNISIDYIGLWYTNPDLVSYRYRLIGLSNTWIPTRDRIVTFPNLPPGTYKFEVIAGIGGQFKSQKVLTYGFRIMKPMWKENWFIIGIFLVVATVIILVIRDRDVRLRKLENLKKEKIEYQFATLKSQVNPHFLFNSFNTLIAIIEIDKETAIDYVEKLSDYFRNLVHHRDKDLVTLQEEIDMVNTYYYLQQKRFGDALQLIIDIPNEWRFKYGVPPLSLQLLIENAVKHNAVSHETPLTVYVNVKDNRSLIIRNTLNPKMHPEPSAGIGLQNIISRFQIVSGEKVIVSFIHDEFVVQIPLIKMNHESTNH
jgi:ligand-binding sensor domain-containing protein